MTQVGARAGQSHINLPPDRSAGCLGTDVTLFRLGFVSLVVPSSQKTAAPHGVLTWKPLAERDRSNDANGARLAAHL